jgi:hypothetical protein
VKHGRGKHAEVSFVDPTPSKELIKRAKWNMPRNQKRYFLNTIQEDVNDTQGQSAAVINEIYNSSSAMRLGKSPRITDISAADGMLFQYCEYASVTC